MTLGSDELKTLLEATIIGINVFFGFLLKFFNSRLKEHEAQFLRKDDIIHLSQNYTKLETASALRNEYIKDKLDEIDKKIDTLFNKLDTMMTKDECQRLREANGKAKRTSSRKRSS